VVSQLFEKDGKNVMIVYDSKGRLKAVFEK